MRLVTRGDLDGLVCTVLLGAVEEIGGIELVHPQHITDNIFSVGKDDIIAKLPYHPDCGMWFSHAEINESNVMPPKVFKGRHAVAPSTARVIYDHYASPKLKPYERLVSGCDRFSSAALTPGEVEHPEGAILLGFLIDPRTSFGPFKVFFKSLAMRLKKMTVEELLAEPDVAERVELYRHSQEEFKEALLNNSIVSGNVVVTDFRGLRSVPVGNRFLIYKLFPQCNVSVRLRWGPKKQFVAATIGCSIFTPGCPTNIGNLCSDFGGGGHQKAGSCPLEPETAEEHVKEIVERLLSGETCE